MMYRENVVNSLRFNQDQSLFVCCLNDSIRIYSTEPLCEKARYDVEDIGAIKFCELIRRTNAIVMVPSDKQEVEMNNCMLLFDAKNKLFCLKTEFQSSVKAIRATRNRLFAALLNEIDVFHFPSLEYILRISTPSNPRGLFEISALDSVDQHIIFYPGHKTGSVFVTNILFNDYSRTSVSPISINAHRNELACMAVNHDGSLLATASVKGTLVRLWDSAQKSLKIELRRGSDAATIYCLNFSNNSEFLCCSSDKGTIHIYALHNSKLNRRSKFNSIRILGSYGNSQWDVANFTIPPECSCICGFGSGNSVIAACVDGTFFKYVFDLEGNCNKEAYGIFLDIGSDDDDSDDDFM